MQAPATDSSFCSASSLPEDTLEASSEEPGITDAVQEIERVVCGLIKGREEKSELNKFTPTASLPPPTTSDAVSACVPASTPIKSTWVSKTKSRRTKSPKKPKEDIQLTNTETKKSKDSGSPGLQPSVERLSDRTLFVYGIKKNDSGPEESAEELAAELQSVFKVVLPPTENVTISRVLRLKTANSGVNNPGPLKVTLASKEERDCLLNNRKKMSSASRDQTPFFCREYSLAERIKHRLLQAELAQRIETGEYNLVIRNGKIVSKKAPKGFLQVPLKISGCVKRR